MICIMIWGQVYHGVQLLIHTKTEVGYKNFLFFSTKCYRLFLQLLMLRKLLNFYSLKNWIQKYNNRTDCCDLNCRLLYSCSIRLMTTEKKG